GKWQGVVLAWKALAQSLNIPAIRVLDMVGFDAVIQRAATLLHITDRQEIERTFPRVYPLALGVVALRPIQLARAFAAFGNGGKAVEPIAVRSVEDRLGRVILDPEREVRARLRAQGAATQLISAENAALMTNMLEKTV
ncbi:penicillin-binding transpeptidase domain-containing protein, partial [Treponema pallidum]